MAWPVGVPTVSVSSEPEGFAVQAESEMTGTRTNRRQFLNSAAAAGVSAAIFPSPLLSQGAGPHVIVIGGGFAGATCARSLKKTDPRHKRITLSVRPGSALIGRQQDRKRGIRDHQRDLRRIVVSQRQRQRGIERDLWNRR